MKNLFWLGGALLLASAPTQARFIATDTGDPEDPSVPIHTQASPGCASDLGGTCRPFNLGFSADFGNGRTNKIYLYDDGQVTFGAPAGGGGADFGSGSVAGSLRDPNLGGYFYRTAYFDRTGGAFNVRWQTCATPGSGSTDCFNFSQDVYLTIVPDYVTRMVTMTLDISGFYDDFAYFDGTHFADFGYSIGNQVLPLSPLTADSAFSISVPFGVPEPANWALMIAGFGMTGTALRRRRGLPAAG